MRICNEVDYAVRAMLVMAKAKDELLSSKTIAEKYTIPYNFLTLILPRLVKAGLVVSIQGPKGGYRVSKPLSEICLFDIVSAVDCKIEITHCQTEKGCEHDSYCPMNPVWEKLNDQIKDYLKSVTLDEVLNDKR